MRLSGPVAMVKPTSAARARIISRVAAESSGVRPYFWKMCSPMFWPPAGMSGLSSKGWKVMSAATTSAVRASACSSAPSPMTHHGQETSETKSILMGLVMWRAPGRRPGI